MMFQKIKQGLQCKLSSTNSLKPCSPTTSQLNTKAPEVPNEGDDPEIKGKAAPQSGNAKATRSSTSLPITIYSDDGPILPFESRRKYPPPWEREEGDDKGPRFEKVAGNSIYFYNPLVPIIDEYWYIETDKVINREEMYSYCQSTAEFKAYKAAAKKARADENANKATPQVGNAKAIGPSMSADRAVEEGSSPSQQHSAVDGDKKVSTEEIVNEK
ncbi:hypothetical protein F5Y08DRAFT_342376 [Xylaria arbuscula]|nr:hypothetical protein F5Y08DRAFT_342376 [Xylaria arbuscula]